MNKAEKRFRKQTRKIRGRAERAEDRSRYAISPEAFQAPRGFPEINRDADVAAKLQYGGALSQNALQGRQIPEWFAQYKQSLLTPEQVQAQYQPAIAQSQQVAQETAKPLGLEGAAGEQDSLAAKAREALAQLGTSVLSGAQQADTTYFQRRQGVAGAAQIGALSQNTAQRGQLVADRDAYRAKYVSDAREGERAYGLASQHQLAENKAFGLDVAKAQADVRTDRQKIRSDTREKQRARKDKGQVVNQYGYTAEQWARFSPSHRQRIMADQKASGKSAPEAAKAYTPAQHHTATVDLRKAVALVQGRLGGKKTAPDTYWKQAYQALISEKGMDPALARAAIQLVRGGGVGAKTRAALERDYGITKFPKGSKRKKPPAYVLPKRPTAPNRDRQPG